MNKLFWAVFWVSLMLTRLGWAISAEDIQRLHKAGLSGDTIQLIIQAKVVETCAFTIQELIDLKTRARLSDKTMQALIADGSFLKDREPVVYGQDVKPIHLTTVADIIELKRAGISDDILHAIILSSGSNSASQTDRENAWRMLNNSGIVVDTRSMP